METIDFLKRNLVITATNFCKNLDMTLEIISNNNNSVDLFCNGFLKIKMCKKKMVTAVFYFHVKCLVQFFIAKKEE